MNTTMNFYFTQLLRRGNKNRFSSVVKGQYFSRGIFYNNMFRLGNWNSLNVGYLIHTNLKNPQINSSLLIYLKIAGLTFIALYLFNKNSENNHAKNCGIIGYIGNEKNAVQICVEGIQILQFRGYDSAGVCTLDSQYQFQLTKLASDFFGTNHSDCIQRIVDIVPKTHEVSSLGIAHTRWATHGRKISVNAHPHLDFSGKIALVHNGIIDNYKELKAFLISQGIELKSETDTEVIVQLIGYYYNKGLSFKEAVSKTLNKHVDGSYALVIMNKDNPDTLICARNGSPLVVGIGNDFFIVSSDVASFQKWTNNYFNIENQDIVELNLSMKLNHLKIKTTIYEEVLFKPKEPFEHFMLQEIMEQPDTINRAMNYGSRFKPISNKLTGIKLGGLEQYIDYLKNSKNLVIVACGTSYFASMFVANLMRKLEIFNTVQIVDGAEFSSEYIPKDNPIMIFVSQSGETYDVLRPLEVARNKGVICLGIVNKVESTLAKNVLCGVFINAGREISVASTKAFSGQVVALALTTLFFSQIKYETSFLNPVYEKSVEFLKNLPNVLPNFLNDNLDICKKIANTLNEFSSLFILGKGFGEAIAREISLKIKEVSYIHAEAYNAGTFKHGPIAMIDSSTRTPVIIIVVKDNFYDDMVSSYNQIKARNARVILLTNASDSELDYENVDYCIKLPNEGLMSSFYAVFMGQLIAYNLAITKGFNPDKPRQLSKELTTK